MTDESQWNWTTIPPNENPPIGTQLIFNWDGEQYPGTVVSVHDIPDTHPRMRGLDAKACALKRERNYRGVNEGGNMRGVAWIDFGKEVFSENPAWCSMAPEFYVRFTERYAILWL